MSAQQISWLVALEEVARHYHLNVPRETMRQYRELPPEGSVDAVLLSLAQRMGLKLEFKLPDEQLPSFNKLPLIAELDDGAVVVISSLTSEGDALIRLCEYWSDDGPPPENRLRAAELFARVRRFGVARPMRAVPDARVDNYIKPHNPHWLTSILFRDLRYYSNVLVASLLANLLGFASILFSMQVYDRVVPAQSFPTLYILFSGVLLAVLFDFLLRRMRMSIIDVLGKRADLTLSDKVFGRALRIRSDSRPPSTGSFIAQLRDVEQIREMLTSTTVAAIVDLPFFFLFLGLFAVIGGWLALVPLAALILLILPGVLMQKKLHFYAQEGMRESSLRNAMLIEAVQRIDDLKMLQAEARFEQQWNLANEVTSTNQLKLRQLTNILTVWTQCMQTLTFATVILFGAPKVMEGDMTTGALVGASILGSRMLGPLSQLTQLFSRLQHARIGIQSLDGIMSLPTDSSSDQSRIALPQVQGSYEMRGAAYRYGDANQPIVLNVDELQIKAGEKIAVLGRNGAGKSTLLAGLSGLILPVQGEVLLDNLTLHQIDPADVRHATGWLSQNSALFHGTIRDNLVLGKPRASDAEILRALAMVGADEFIRRLPSGLSYPVMEGGSGLSGGQIQALLLARLLIREPQILLLDEPTTAMDEATEQHFIRHFEPWAKNKTVVIATHRMRVLDLVDRIIVVNNGQIVLDDRKDKALMKMRGKAR